MLVKSPELFLLVDASQRGMKGLLLAILLQLVSVIWGAPCPLIKRDPVPANEDSYPEPKYFKEAFDPHYDARFMREALDEESHRRVLRVLVQTYLATCQRLGVRTWLMHGSLPGWWWGKKVMPWDFDADVQVTEADLYYLAAYHNMTVYYYKYGRMGKGRYFLLDINAHFKHRETDDVLNFIDARWIDMATGLYIDVTAARYRLNHPAGKGVMYDKNDHEFRNTYLYPLRETIFEGVPALIPFKYKEMLESEYGKAALTQRVFHEHIFDQGREQWVLTPQEEQA